MQPVFLKTELLFDHSEWMLNLGADAGLGGFDKVLQTFLLYVRQSAAFAGPHLDPKLRSALCHSGSLSNALAASIAVHYLLIAMQQLRSRGEDVQFGSLDYHRMDYA